ncbi:MAG: hypothetical protein KKC51_01400 [Verrucomicrobia bacterium]|nr:hypothetical protein [Verrucomicrobiota bacterium]
MPAIRHQTGFTMKNVVTIVWFWITAGVLYAASPVREPLTFQYAWDVGADRSVFVVGSHDDVGAWGPTNAVKLCWTAGNVWTGLVAVQAGTALEYKFIARTNSADQYGNGENVEWMAGDNLSTQVVAQPDAPYTGKTILYHSGWTNAGLVYRVGTNWYGTAMQQAGGGRTVNEYLYRAEGFGEEGDPLEFVPYGTYNGTQYWDHAPYGGYGDSNYYTTLDVFFLQDGNIYNYRPPTNVSASRIDSTNVTSSWAPTIPSRMCRIYVPRGYGENTWKRYPALYMHDGTNVFQPGGIFGCWNAELIADKEISQGRMRECIIVAVDNSPERNREYIPPGDDSGAGSGTADQYANFLIHNVRPMVDAHYRTLNDWSNTLTIGSSFGGLVSFYLGFETNVFGKIGPMSTAFWPADKFVGRIETNRYHGPRIYMDMGTEEPSLWDENMDAYDQLLDNEYAVNADLLLEVGCGHEHNEAAWAARLPDTYHFILSLWDEPNLLAQEEHLPVIDTASATSFAVEFTALRGRTYQLERSLTLAAGSWTNAGALAEELLPWAPRTIQDTNPPSVSGPVFYRIATESWPPVP